MQRITSIRVAVSIIVHVTLSKLALLSCRSTKTFSAALMQAFRLGSSMA